MKFNYLKEAKENGRYMDAHWLAWAYHFQRIDDKLNTARNLKWFLEEIARICDK